MNRIDVVGVGHHERASYATELVRGLCQAGFSVVVHTDLRPRLASDLASLLEAGASSINLSGSGIAALVVSEADAAVLQEPHSEEPSAVQVRLLAGNGETRALLVESATKESKGLLESVLKAM